MRLRYICLFYVISCLATAENIIVDKTEIQKTFKEYVKAVHEKHRQEIAGIQKAHRFEVNTIILVKNQEIADLHEEIRRLKNKCKCD